jgi:hypothetical protein
VTRWTSFDPGTASHIKSVEDWAEWMSGDFVRRQFDPDYLEKVDGYVGEFGAGAAGLLLAG